MGRVCLANMLTAIQCLVVATALWFVYFAFAGKYGLPNVAFDMNLAVIPL